MKSRIAVLIAGCFLTVLLAGLLTGCADKFDQAEKLRRDGDYSAAINGYTEILASAPQDREAFGARFMRGICYLDTNQYSKAYVDMYMAGKMACWIDANQKQTSPNRAAVGSLAVNEACEVAAPKRLKEIASKMTPAEIEAAEKEADLQLPAKFKK